MRLQKIFGDDDNIMKTVRFSSVSKVFFYFFLKKSNRKAGFPLTVGQMGPMGRIGKARKASLQREIFELQKFALSCHTMSCVISVSSVQVQGGGAGN